MKRIITLSLIMSLMAAVAIAQTSTPTPQPDVRNVRWGMSPDEVIAQEILPLSWYETNTTQTALHYPNLKMFDQEWTLFYVFKDRRLIKMAYFINSKSLDYDFYRPIFDRVYTELTKKYGNTIESENYLQGLWENETYKNTPSKYSDAVLQQHVTFSASFYVGKRSRATVILQGDQTPLMTCVIVYIPFELDKHEDTSADNL